MKIIALAGSISSDSINKKLTRHVATLFAEHEVEVLELEDYQMPMLSSDAEAEIGVHPLAAALAEKIDGADLLILALAEYNSAYTGAFKNTFDWLSRVKDRKAFGDKPVFLLSAAPGPGGGKNVAEMFQRRAPFSGADIIEVFALPKCKETFNEGEGILDHDKKVELEAKVESVKNQMKNR